MTDIAFMLRPHLSRWAQLRAYLTKDLAVFNFNHVLYVPEKFILGNFKERKWGFELDEDNVTYLDSPETLVFYQRQYEQGMYVSSKKLILANDTSAELMSRGRVYSEAHETLVGSIEGFVEENLTHHSSLKAL